MKLKFFTILLAGFFLLTLTANAAGDILIEKGLAYLASVQSTSKGTEQLTGTSIDPHNLPVTDTKIAGHWQSNPGITALCLQVFIANGHGVNDPLYGTNVTNAINYILSQQVTSGLHTGAIGTWVYGYETAMAIVALKSALKSGGLVDPLKTQVENAVALATNYYTQDVNIAWTHASWRYDRTYTSEINGDMSVSQWVILALDAAEYTGKDIWNKIYGYINYRKVLAGSVAYMTYHRNDQRWARGNTAAGIWGLILAKSQGVAGADALSQKFYGFLEQNSLNELFNPASISNHVYDGGGYYYYTYELAKALSLGGKTNFAGGAWYNHLYGVINSQKYTDGNGNYFWDRWGGQGAPMETALALLALQTGTVPPGSKLVISLEDISKDENCIEFTINDGAGNAAGVTETGVFNNIPGSQWLETGAGYMEWEKDLDDAGNYGTLVKNVCSTSKSPITLELCFRAYVENDMVDEECYIIVIQPQRSIGASAFVNAIGGLNIILTNPPEEIPIMELEPATINFPQFIFDHTYNFTFLVKEVGGESPLVNIDLFASDLTDQFGNVIPAGNFTLTPNFIALIPAGGSVEVQGSLLTPASFVKGEPHFFQGTITGQTNQQAKGIAFSIGQSAPPPPVPLSNWAIFLSLFLIVGFIVLYFRMK